jgi:hypothetical protein
VQTVGWATGISKLHTTSIKRTYMEGSCRRVIAGSERACKEGEESKVLEMPRADCGLSNGCQRNTYSICKMYVHREGRYGVQPSLRGRGGVQSPGDAARRLWVGQQVLASTYSIFKMYLRGEGLPRGPS